MEQILNYLSENKEWLFSGAGLLIFSAIGLIIKTIHSRKEKKHTNKTMSQLNTNHSSGTQIGIEQNRCAMACQGCGAVLFLLKKQWNYFS